MCKYVLRHTVTQQFVCLTWHGDPIMCVINITRDLNVCEYVQHDIMVALQYLRVTSHGDLKVCKYVLHHTVTQQCVRVTSHGDPTMCACNITW